MEIQYNFFFPKEKKGDKYAEEKYNATQDYPEKCFFKTFNVSASD